MDADAPCPNIISLQEEQGPGPAFTCGTHNPLECVGRFADDGDAVDGIGPADPFQQISQRYFTLALIEIEQFVLWNGQQNGSLTGRQYPVQPGNQ